MEIQSPGQKRGRRLRIKNKGGAPIGNRNALKHGGFTKEKLTARNALKKEVRTLILNVHLAVARAMFATIGRKPNVTVTRTALTPSPRRPSN